MGIGLGILLIVLGAILTWAVEFDLEFLDDDALGVILLAAGALAIILALVRTAPPRPTHNTFYARGYGHDRY